MTFSDWSWPILFWRFFSALISVMMSHLNFFFLLFTLWLAFLSLTFLSCVSQDSVPSSLFFSLSSESFSYWNTIFNYPFHVDDSCVIHRRLTHKLLVYVMIPPRCSWFSHLSGQLSYSCLILPMRRQNPSQNTEYSVLLLIDEKKKRGGWSIKYYPGRLCFLLFLFWSQLGRCTHHFEPILHWSKFSDIVTPNWKESWSVESNYTKDQMEKCFSEYMAVSAMTPTSQSPAVTYPEQSLYSLMLQNIQAWFYHILFQPSKFKIDLITDL